MDREESRLDAFYTLAPHSLRNKVNGRYTLMCDHEEVGSVVLVAQDPDILEVWSVEVYPEYRGLGHGLALMFQVEALARHLAFTKLWLRCNKDNDIALRLYAKLGFTVDSERRHDFALTKEVKK